MRELSMHILDLAQNSIAANARRLNIEVCAETAADRLSISITDDGIGMEPDLLAKAKDPFTSTRRSRHVGLGIPLFAEAVRACDGRFAIQSAPGKGTYLVGTFRLSHIDRAPLGDIASTLISIVALNQDLALRYVQRVDDRVFVFDTEDLRGQLGEVPINEGPVLKWLREYIETGISGSLAIQ